MSVKVTRYDQEAPVINIADINDTDEISVSIFPHQLGTFFKELREALTKDERSLLIRYLINPTKDETPHSLEDLNLKTKRL